ncbi:esterase family protein [Chryseobacterium indologenes]|uniref:alpha/beta hydrolase n=2 Tax=Chryseobacterium indologenes TaxID=253 RepID=UPI0003E07BB7|nr:alpha/beta hydrolase-fold protein [Chryseobacterium indologenes]ASE61168.1 esterase [Chryseobacterium indologenes]QPQ51371.1 esterase family protein [Chryseobacterium indologenes]TLX26971.1 esterase family protein [Chryseobacterium indologenes]SFI91722.1 S-formylglutathione hydrolase FrmB [Chryseobacterium indologenes]SUX49789.1 enterobactin/ferric enterobactin esterase [Chryseobacterium indologenes]
MKKLINIVVILTAFTQMSAQKIIHQEIFSPKMNKKIKTIIITPNVQPKTTYPSVYILHGFSGTPDRILKEDIPDLVKKAQEYKTIYILPDGNYSSWYVDSPLVKDSQYQTFIGKELVEFVDKNYPVKSEKKYRGILGWSMGGYGATNIGVIYNKTFGIVGSSCGALDFTVFGEGYQKYMVNKVLGPLESINPTFLTDNKIKLMATAGQQYIFDCGTDDTQMIQMNRNFHKKLTEAKVQHLYTESLGGHVTEYWSRSLSEQLSLFNRFFKQ